MLTQEQAVTNYETTKHIRLVQSILHKFIKELLDRADLHDLSKLESPEVEIFTEFTPKLAASTYGSKEYDEFRVAMGPALDHHYAKNKHHPEHYKNGVNDMNLIDLLEMFADWFAATKRHNDGNILKSIEHNTNRFNLSPQLAKILENTANLLSDKENENGTDK